MIDILLTILFSAVALIAIVHASITVYRIIRSSRKDHVSVLVTIKNYFKMQKAPIDLDAEHYCDGFYRRYRIRGFNGNGTDLLINHTSLVKHPKLRHYELQFLNLKFGETGTVYWKDTNHPELLEGLDQEELSVSVISQSTDISSMNNRIHILSK